MRNYADADNIHARIYAMKGRLLSLREYASISREQTSDKVSGARDLIEARETIFREQIAPIISIAGAYDKYAPLFLAYLRQYEAHNVKLLLARASGRESLDQWYDIGPFAVLDKSLLRNRLSANEIKSFLADTYLACVFQNITSYRRMEMEVDQSAVKIFYDASGALTGEAKREFQEMMLRRIAVLTVIWSYRLKQYYHWSDEKIGSYLGPFHDLFGSHAAPQVQQVKEALNRHLEQLRKSAGQEPSVVDIERHLEQEYYDWVSFMFHRDFHAIYCVVAYLWLLFYQVKNLFRIMDGRRFGFSAEAILSRLICQA